MDKVDGNIEETHELIKKCVPEEKIDCLEVVKRVERYRQFWKPSKTKVVLLAESHVYTDKKDYEIKRSSLLVNKFIPNYPLGFVRFVYCLGYGENELLNEPIKNNGGTPQYWKIFSSCVAENKNDLGFHRVLKSKKNGTPSLLERIANKVSILQKMQERGIWLLDASIVGIHGSGIEDYKTKKTIIENCWQNRIETTIRELNPKHIVAIGKGVGNILNSELQELKIPFEILPQPQGVRSSQGQNEYYKCYYEICERHCINL